VAPTLLEGDVILVDRDVKPTSGAIVLAKEKIGDETFYPVRIAQTRHAR
jgi:hypothetical protein